MYLPTPHYELAFKDVVGNLFDQDGRFAMRGALPFGGH
jgi:hypothetical protein